MPAYLMTQNGEVAHKASLHRAAHRVALRLSHRWKWLSMVRQCCVINPFIHRARPFEKNKGSSLGLVSFSEAPPLSPPAKKKLFQVATKVDEEEK